MTRRGTIVSFAAGTYLAVIRLDGSGAQAIANIPTNRAILALDMTAGRRVVVDMGDAQAAADLIVLALVF